MCSMVLIDDFERLIDLATEGCVATHVVSFLRPAAHVLQVHHRPVDKLVLRLLLLQLLLILLPLQQLVVVVEV